MEADKTTTTSQATATTTNETSGRRRSSNTMMPAFGSLMDQKRGGDPNTARRQSLTDQRAQPGIFAKVFHGFVGRDAK